MTSDILFDLAVDLTRRTWEHRLPLGTKPTATCPCCGSESPYLGTRDGGLTAYTCPKGHLVLIPSVGHRE